MRKRFHKYHKCPTCKNVHQIDYRVGDPLPKNFPFCSKRCTDVDLLRWFTDTERSLETQAQSRTFVQKPYRVKSLDGDEELDIDD